MHGPLIIHRNIIQDFQAASVSEHRFYTREDHLVFALPIVYHDLKKSASDYPTAPAYATCLPVSILELQLQTTHKGRVLIGTVAVEDLSVMEGVVLLLRDEKGDVVMVSNQT